MDMEFEKRGDHIGVFHNAIDDELVDKILDNYKFYEEEGLAKSRPSYDPAPPLDKEDTAVGMVHRYKEDYEGQVLRVRNELAIWDALNRDILPQYRDAYGMRNDIDVITIDGKIQRTDKGQGYHQWHYESDTPVTRHRILAWMIYLNDVEEGGETEFLYQHCRFKPVKGTCLVWPAQFTHIHRGNPPLSNTKYICTGWGEYWNE